MQRASEFLLIPLWTRFLTPADYGITELTSAFTGVLMPITTMGLYGYVARFYYEALDDKEKQKEYIFSVTIFQIIVSSALLFLFWIIGPIIWPMITRNSVPFSPYVQLMLLTVFFTSVIRIPLSLYQTRQKALQYSITQYSVFLLNFIAAMILVVWFRQGAYGNMMAKLSAYAIIGTGSTLLVLKQWATSRFNWRAVREGLAFGIPLIPHMLAGWLSNAGDRLVQERFLDIQEIGLYGFGYKIGMIMENLVNSINLAWMPQYFEWMTNDPSPEVKISNIFSLYMNLVGALCLLLILFMGEIFYLILPDNFFASLPYIGPVLVGFYFLGFYKFAVAPFFYYKKTKIIPLFTGLISLANFILNIFLVPIYGAIASAWITMFTYGIFSFFAFLVGRKYQKIPFPIIRYLFICAYLVLVSIFIGHIGIFNISAVLIKIGLFLGFILVNYQTIHTTLKKVLI